MERQNAPAPLFEAALKGDVVAVSALLEAKEDIHTTDKVPAAIFQYVNPAFIVRYRVASFKKERVGDAYTFFSSRVAS